MNSRNLLREQLDELTGDMPEVKRRKLEKLVFDLYHTKQAACRLREEDAKQHHAQVQKLPGLELELKDAQLRIEQLEQTLQARDRQNASLVVQIAANEKALDNFRKPVINLDRLDMSILEHLCAMSRCTKQIEILNHDMRETLLTIAYNRKDEKLLNYFKKLTQEQLLMFSHLGFSELNFLAAITGDNSYTPIGFLVNGVEYPPPKNLYQRYNK